MAGVLVAIAVRMSDKGSLPVVVDKGVGDGDIVGGVGDLIMLVPLGPRLLGSFLAYIDQTVVVVLVMVGVGRHVAVINPHVRRFL